MTKSDSYLWNNVCMPIYRELFITAQPSCDIDKLLKEGKEVKNTNWFMRYYLDDKTQESIIKKHCKKHKLSIMDTKKVFNEIVLGFSPTSNKSMIHGDYLKEIYNRRGCRQEST